MSVSNIPIIVLGSKETAAAKFVDRFNLGVVVDYEPRQFQTAVERVLSRERNDEIRQVAQELAPVFSAKKMAKWIEESIQLKQPADNRFEYVFSKIETKRTWPKFKRRSNWNKEIIRSMLSRLQRQGFAPELVVDVGSGDGNWSWSASQVFPNSKFVLIEPLLSRYSQMDRQFYQRSLVDHEILELTLSNKQGETEFGDESIQQDILMPNSFGGLSAFARQTNQILTLDELADRKNWSGTTLLKVDARLAEYFVFAGGMEFIRKHVQVILVTVDLEPKHATAKSYGELLKLMESMGLQLIDECEAKRCPKTDMLQSKNFVFAKKDLVQKRLAA